ncbi:MAG: LysR substrate-binding domain-containing protein, partial [Desulfurobacteriaceae bacterium]
MVPTAEAELLYRHAVEILRKREEAISELLSLDKTPVFKEVRIAASNIPGDYLLPHNLNRLRNIFSGAKVIVDILDSQKVLTVLLEKASIYDLGFVGTEVDDSRIESKKVLSDEIVLIAPPYFKKSEVHLSELS